MKAILKVNKNSSYSHLNGHTFKVNMFIGDKLINLQFEDHTADFSNKEVFIVDVQSEMQSLYNSHNWYGGSGNRIQLDWLEKYCLVNNIVVGELILTKQNNFMKSD